MTPIVAVARGVVAGAVGTMALDAYWYVRYRAGGGTTGPLRWEFVTEQDWDRISAPGRLGRKLIEGVTGKPLAPRWAPLVNNVMHWGYGVGSAAVYGVVAGSLRKPRPLYGVPFGVIVWLNGYAVLPLAHVYKPIWEYDATTLATDLGGHLVYGLATGATFAALA
jgi:hypothetical protein